MSKHVILTLFLAASPSWASIVPAGTDLVVRLETAVGPSSKKSKSPENFSATLDQPVFVNGTEMLPAGSRVEGEVRGDRKRLLLSPQQIILPDGRKVEFNASVKALDHEKLKLEQKEGTIQGGGSAADASRQAAEIGMAGAGVGAMSTGSMKGMGIGAAAGVDAVLIGRKIAGRHHGGTEVPAGTQLTLTLNRPLDVPSDAAQAQAPDKSDPDERRPILRRQN